MLQAIQTSGSPIMANRHRGEIAACLNGQHYTLCLTLGALAELEGAFGDEDMLALAQRLEKGRLSAKDAMRIIGAGLRGAGHEIADSAVGTMQAEGGVAGFIDIVARLLSATVAADEGANTATGSGARAEERAPVPFPGTT